MKVLITGASGLLGSHLLAHALERGDEVVALSRSTPARSFLVKHQDSVHYHSVDLLDATSWPENLFEDVQTVIHTAALASPFRKDFGTMSQLNVETPKALMKRAAQAGVQSYLHVSSVATLCDGRDNSHRNERDQGKMRSSHYAQTKWQIDQWIARQDFPFRRITIHPCYMLGRWDARPSSGAILLSIKMRVLTHFINCTKNFVAASDVARGMWQAIDCPNASGHYVLGGENLPIEEFARQVIHKLGLDPDRYHIHSADEFDQLELAEKKKALSREFCLSNPISSQRAADTFGYTPQLSFEQMLDETVHFFKEHRLLH